MPKPSLKLANIRLLLLAGLVAYGPVSSAWAQQSQGQPEPRRGQLSSPKLTPTVLPAASVVEPWSMVGAGLAACAESASSEPLSLPSVRGEVKLDRCYRGRDNLTCRFNAILKEAKSLLSDYTKMVEAGYTQVRDVDDICIIKSSNLETDLQNATEFNERFKSLNAAYDAVANCASNVVQSLGYVTLPNVTRGQEILKSMIESIQQERQNVSDTQDRLLSLVEKVNSSQKAMFSIQKIHRVMCMTASQGVTADRPKRP